MSSRGEYRPIYAVLQDSEEFKALSKDAKLLWYGLKLSLGPSGIDVLFDDQLAERAGITLEELQPARAELVEAGWIEVERRVHWLINGLRFEPTISLNNAKHRTGIERHLQGLPKLPVVNRMAAYYGISAPFPTLDAKASEWVSEGNRSREREREPERDRETDPEDASIGDSAPANKVPPPNPTPSADQPDFLHEFLVEHPVAVEILSGLKHAGGKRATKATLEYGFLYADGEETLGDPSVRGLPLDKRKGLLVRALLEYRDQGETEWDTRHFAGFVRRLKTADDKGVTAEAVGVLRSPPIRPPEPEISEAERLEVARLARQTKETLRGPGVAA